MSRGREYGVGVALLAPALVLLAVLLIWPVAQLLMRSFSDPAGPLVHYERLVSVPSYLQILLRTLLFSSGTAVLCLLLGYPVAYALANTGSVVRGLILIAVMLPLWTNLLVRSYGWIVLLSTRGVLNDSAMALGIIIQPLELLYNAQGVLIGMTQIMLPYMILPIYAVMVRLDRRLPDAARSLGAGPIATFAKVYGPLTLPGVMSGLLLVFTISLGFFVIPALLGGAKGQMVAQLIEFNINGSLNWGMASALSVTLLVVTLAIFWIGDRWFNLGAIWGIER